MVVIAARFCGPPDSGNGGYSAGSLAQQLSGAVEVTLRKPPPLERELAIIERGDHIELAHEGELIAEARSTTLDLAHPEPPSFEGASEQSLHYIGHSKHHFPGCFVCGPARAVGDGLRIFPGASKVGESVAAPWTPDRSLIGAGGAVRPEIMWAALDCVGYFGVAGPDYPVALLGRITAELVGEIGAGERCVVTGWSMGRDGRKLHAGTAIFGDDGRLRAKARQTWISIKG
ncbi:MAG TPA: hypothetical protein VHB79_32830 [Polyangiaceae bacterium]|nr:hypothetical protein [Polyangiaceae bacterium]